MKNVRLQERNSMHEPAFKSGNCDSLETVKFGAIASPKRLTNAFKSNQLIAGDPGGL